MPILPVSKGSCGCVRCADDRGAVLDDLARHVGVMVETEHDRDVGAEDRAAELDLLALDVVDALGRAGAVELERKPVDRAGRLEAGADALLEEVVGVRA